MTLDDEWMALSHELLPRADWQELSHVAAGDQHHQQWFMTGAKLAHDPLTYVGGGIRTSRAVVKVNKRKNSGL